MDLGSEHERHLAEKAAEKPPPAACWVLAAGVESARSSRSQQSCTTTRRQLICKCMPGHDSFLFNSETREDIKAFYMRLNEDRPKWSTEKA